MDSGRFGAHVVGSRVTRAPHAAAPALKHRRNGVLTPGSASASSRTLRPSVIFSAHRLHVTVGGCAAFYSAELSCPPDHPVTISPGNLPTCIRVSPTLQVFTKDNWNKPQFFRVAAIASATFESETGAKDDRKCLQVVEHFGSSVDPRFNGNRLLYLPASLLIHVSPRDGVCVFTCGRLLGTTRAVEKAAATATVHDFQQLELDPNAVRMASGVTPDLVARSSSMVTTNAHAAVGAAAAIAAVRAANTATHAAASRERRKASAMASNGTSTSAASNDAMEALFSKEALSFVKIASRKHQTVLLQRNGQLIVLGKRESDADISSASPRLVEKRRSGDEEGPSDVASDAALSKVLTDVDCGDEHVVAITEHGYLLTWGDGRDGRLGHGSDASRSTPRLVRALLHKRIVHVACGARHTLVLAEDGDVYAWGYNCSGALGLALSEQSRVAVDSAMLPMEVLTLKHRGVAKISCGDLHTAVVLMSGELLTCGWAEHGRLGRVHAAKDEFSPCFAPVDLQGRLCTLVACGGSHTLVLTACSTLWAFGCNSSGQLGLGDCRHRATPTRVEYFEDGEDHGLVLTGLAAGMMHSLATTQDTRVFAWGSDEFGQCGVGSFPQIYTVPHLVPSSVGLGTTQVAAGDAHAVLLGQASQKTLDAIETNHPARYAALIDRYEQYMRQDRARRAQILQQVKRQLHAHEAGMRQRKPPPDAVSLRRQLEFQAASDAAQRLLESAKPVVLTASTPRPQTAAALVKCSSRPMRQRPATSSRGRQHTTASTDDSTFKKKVRCSSATLWRQTRLFTFQKPQELESGQQDAAEAPTPTRPPSRQLKLSAQARRHLGQLLDDDAGTREAEKAEGRAREAVVATGRFPASRPKSAPVRATVSAMAS